jgi:uncharacterized protein (DUF1330 family)
MNRGLRLFLIFIAVLVVVGSVSAFFIGPGLLNFALDVDRRSSPVVLASFTKLRNEVDRDAYERNVFKVLDAQVESLGGEVFWRGSTSRVLWGRVLDEWDFVSLMRLPRGATFLELITRSDYRDHRVQTETQREREVTYVVDGFFEDIQADVLVVYLVDLFDLLQTEGIDLVSASIARYGGQEVRRTPLTALVVGDVSWNTLVVFRFDTAAGLNGWIEDNERLTVAAIAGSKVRDHRLLVISR